MIRHALTESAALCINDASYTVWSSQTVVQAQLTSMIAVPLVESTVARGAIVRGSRAMPRCAVERHDLRLLTGIAEVSAGPLLNALKMERLERENQRLLTELSGTQSLIGNSERMREVYRFVMKVSASDATVLITGESGTGKELVARAVHRTSARARPAVRGDQLRGAHRDAARERAVRPREGRVHRRGRAASSGRFERPTAARCSSTRSASCRRRCRRSCCACCRSASSSASAERDAIQVDVRVVAATNRDLEAEVARRARSARTSTTGSTSSPLDAAAAARAPRGHPAARAALRSPQSRRELSRRVTRLSAEARRALLRGYALARQRARARERDRARDALARHEPSCPTICPSWNRREPHRAVGVGH